MPRGLILFSAFLVAGCTPTTQFRCSVDEDCDDGFGCANERCFLIGPVGPDAGSPVDAGSVADSGAVDAGGDAAVLSDSGAVLDSGDDAAVLSDSGAVVDSGVIDSGAVDSGPIDAGGDDGGAAGDGGGFDSGALDSGVADSGVGVDAGELDAGLDAGLFFYDRFTHRIPLSVDVSASLLTDFVLLAHVVVPGDFDEAVTSQDDLAFFDATGAQLSHEIERFTPPSIIAWVRLPTYVPSTTDLYMTYGRQSGAGTEEDVQGTWPARFEAVYHLRETTGATDATGSHDGTQLHGLMTAGTTDRGGYVEFNNDCVDVTAGANEFDYLSTESFTVLFWMNFTEAPQTVGQMVVSNGAYATSAEGWGVSLAQGGAVQLQANSNGASTYTFTAGIPPAFSWHRYAFIMDRTSSRGRAQVDAFLEVASNADLLAALGNSTGALRVGCDNTGNMRLNAMLDELWIIDGVVEQPYLDALYRNQNNPTATVVSGVVEVAPGAADD